MTKPATRPARSWCKGDEGLASGRAVLSASDSVMVAAVDVMLAMDVDLVRRWVSSCLSLRLSRCALMLGRWLHQPLRFD